MLSLREGGLLGTSVRVASGVNPTDRLGCSESMAMASGVPVPRATGETLSDWRAEMVHASMSTPVDGWFAWDLRAERGLAGAGSAASSGGGGTALYIAMITLRGWSYR